MGFNLIFAVIPALRGPHRAEDKPSAPTARAWWGLWGSSHRPMSPPSQAATRLQHPRGSSGLCAFANCLLFASIRALQQAGAQLPLPPLPAGRGRAAVPQRPSSHPTPAEIAAFGCFICTFLSCPCLKKAQKGSAFKQAPFKRCSSLLVQLPAVTPPPHGAHGAWWDLNCNSWSDVNLPGLLCIL